MRPLPLIAALLLTCAPAAAQSTEDFPDSYEGCKEASAAVPLGDLHFIAANDEDNILRVYNLKERKPVFELNLDAELVSDPKEEAKKRKVDIEGATWLGDKVTLWIGSHSRTTEKGKRRPNRFRLFAVAADPETPGRMQFLGTSKRLLDDLVAADASWGFDLARATGGTAKDYEIGPKDPGGFNIEGLTYIPKTKGVYIGLRNPLSTKRKESGEAILIPLLNPLDMCAKDKKAKFGKPVLLDLGGLSIRSIEYSASRECFLIVGGTYKSGDDDVSTKIFKWSGDAKDAPIPVHTKAESEPAFTPEALIVYERSRSLQLLSDQGKKGDESLGNAFKSRWIVVD